MFKILINKLRSNLSKSNDGFLIGRRSYCNLPEIEAATVNGMNLFRRISALKNPEKNVIPLLNQIVEKGKTIEPSQALSLVRELRRKNQFSHALQASEWMSSRTIYPFSTSASAVRLDLIGVVRGVDAAETYFTELTEEKKDEKTYGALLNTYVREGLLDKSLSHFQKMKEMGYASSPAGYSNLMGLYSRLGQHEKLPELLAEMKRDGVLPDNLSYRMCINYYGQKSDFDSMEKLVKEMKSLSHISMDWTTYSMLANFYIKADLAEKAAFFLKKVEEKVGKDCIGYNHLITLYAQLGNLEEVMRFWDLQKGVRKKQNNRDYITILSMLVKLDELEKAEELLDEWKSTCRTFDFRVPNVLLLAYSRRGLLSRAEVTLENITKTGKTPTPNSFAIIALGHLNNKNMEKALKYMEEALSVAEQHSGWKPNPRLISEIAQWLSDKGAAEKFEAFVNSLKKVLPGSNKEVQALVKASTGTRKEVERMIESVETNEMNGDGDGDGDGDGETGMKTEESLM